MKMHHWIMFLIAMLTPTAFGADRPNVLFIAVDDLNDWVGVLGGHPQAKTPNIDRLAKRGMLFTNAHCSAPVCNASRTSLLFGVRPSTSGVYANADDWRDMDFFKNLTTLPMHFKNAGYKTLGSGKLFHAHTFNKKALSGYPQPEAWDAYWPSKTQQIPHEEAPPGWPINSSKDFYGGHFDWAPMNISDNAMGDRQVAAWASRELGQTHDRPVFLAVGIYRPHVPWWAPQEYFDAFPIDQIQLPAIPPLTPPAVDLDDVPAAGQAIAKREWQQWIVDHNQWKAAAQGYLASMLFADKMVGHVLDALDRGPMANNTIIILWGDHGYHHGEKEHWEKFALWEDSTRVPLIVFDPRRTQAGSQSNQPVSLLDLYPTLVDLCDLKKPDHLEGQSLTPLLDDPAKVTGRAVITTENLNSHAVRSERWRYIRYADGTEELYDHRVDPNEWTNVAANPKNARIKAKLAKWFPKLNTPTPTK